MKYKEKDILKEIEKYILSTYEQHYSNEITYEKGKEKYSKTENNIQAMDIFRNLGIDKNHCHANAIKYLLRYGKKQGRNQEDLYKAIHYIVLLLSSERKDTTTTIGKLFHPEDSKHKK